MLIALILGACSAVVATERLTPSVLLTGTGAFLFVPALLLGTGLLLTAGAAGAPLWMRYLDAHRPWWLWLLAVSALLLVAPEVRPYVDWLAWTALIPSVLTAHQLVRFCRRDLALDTRTTVARLVVHQAATYGVLLAAAAAAVAVWPRILGAFA